MKAIKSIFDKSYIVKAQAEAAGAKEWPQGIPSNIELSHDAATKKFRWVQASGPSAEALVGASNILKAFKDCATAQMAHDSAAQLIEELIDVPSNKAADAMANASMGPKSPRPRLSSCLSPTKKVWHIADSMPKASRKDVMDECVNQGIAYGTARTQYQAWFKASQNGGDGSARKPYEKA